MQLGFTLVLGWYVAPSTSVIDDEKLEAWIDGDGQRYEVTRSYYDQTVISGLPITLNTATQRKRIVHVTYEEVRDNNNNTFDHATHYNYDIHGNVKNLLQENRKMVVEDNQLADQTFKQMDYVYDLVSGNVHRVSYQSGKADQWHHVYQYDADNRITTVHTTETTPMTLEKNGIASLKSEPSISPYWHKEASYAYYKHGPLARTELGSQDVQGIDYIYTIQGWLKGVNSTDLAWERSHKSDGHRDKFAKDVYSYGLHYFDQDYTSISGSYEPFAYQNASDWLNTNSWDLHNGNIARMVTTITEPTTREVLPLGNAYRYDQLNRLFNSVSSADAFDLSNYGWSNTGTGIYGNRFYYDPNGNIKSQYREDEVNHAIDDLKYIYETNRNRLTRVVDLSVSFTDFDDDIDDSEYTYDAEGRLKTDSQEGITDIVWRVDGKVKMIVRNGDPERKNLIFDYDAMGNRIAKHVYNFEYKLQKSTYYVLDASGNVMATYDKEIDYDQSATYFKLKERHIYGSSRVGVRSSDADLLALPNQGYSMRSVHYSIGSRTYELSNHLGNVLSVISDTAAGSHAVNVIPYFEGGGIAEMRADIRVAQDYSPFGVTLSGRNFTVDERYRYGFNGMEKDDEVKGSGNSYDFGARMYDSRLGRWLSIDALAAKYPSMSPYLFAGNSPISCVDHGGDSIFLVINNIAYNISRNKQAWGSEEIKEMAYFTLKATAEGQRILDKYKNSTQTDVYIAIGDVADDDPNDNSTIQAHTTQLAIRDETGKLINENVPKGIPLPSTGDYDVFSGVTTKNKGDVFLIVINEGYLSGAATGSKPDRYTIASVLFHEIRVHIEMSNKVNSEVERQMQALPLAERTDEMRRKLTDQVSHQMYGSYGSPSPTNGSTNFTDESGPARWAKPAWTIFKQIQELRNNNIEKSIQSSSTGE